MFKNLLKASAVIAGGVIAGAVTAAYTYEPVADTAAAYAAAHCMGWKPQGTQQEIPMLPGGMTAQSYRFVTVTAFGTCSGKWTRELREPKRFPPGTPVTVFKGHGGRASYVLVKTSEAPGLRTYMGTMIFNEDPRQRSSNCWFRRQRFLC